MAYESIVFMSLPFSLHGNEYLEHLREFRDAALVESHWFGRRKNIGGFTFGVARAQWRTEEGGTAQLIDEGLRYRSTTIINFLPTTLRISNSHGEMGLEVVTFEMDIDDIGCVDVYQNLFTTGSLFEFAKSELHRRSERKYGLSDPTDEQRELLYSELQRGATGLYPVIYDSESEG